MMWLILLWFIGFTIAFYLLEMAEIRLWKASGCSYRLLERMSAFPMSSILLSLFSWCTVAAVLREAAERRWLDRQIKEIIEKRTPDILKYMEERSSRD